MKKLTEITIFLEKRSYLPRFLSDLGFKDTVINQELSSLHGGSLKITLTVRFT